MKLAILGGATIVLGVALTEIGLVAIGALWVILGPIMRRYGRALNELKGSSGQPVVDSRTFATGTLLWIVLGLPSFLVGLFELGITPEHADWRWLPLVVGALALVIGVLGGSMYALGSAAAKKSPQKTVPATIRIRSVKETGTFINERPRLELELLVEPESGSGLAPYEVTKLATAPFTALGSLQVGGGFAALVNGPEHPTAMDIDWDRPVPPPGGADSSGEVPPSGQVSERLEELDRLLRAGRVTNEEYRAQRERILGSL